VEASPEQIGANGQKGVWPDATEVLKSFPHQASANPIADNGKVKRTQQPDEELIRACLCADREAWAALLERYSGLIYSTAWKSNLPPEDVADVFQSVVLALLEGLGDLRDQTKLSSWLTTVTVHECLRVKRRRARPLTSLEEIEEQVVNIPDESLLPDEMIQLLEKQQLVRQALSMMDEPCRRLLTRLFFEKDDWSYEKISGELGLSVSTIGPKRGRCLKKLLQILMKLGF
jgi:RNA polymerase sigma factor (sigma-70 family)